MPAASAARSGRMARAATAAHAVATTTLTPAMALNARTVWPGDRANTRTIAAETSVNAGPYADRTCSHCVDVTATKGSRGNDAGASAYGLR